MQAFEHVFIEGKPHDARWAETLGLSDLLAFVNVGPGDPAGRHCRYGIGHDADDAAELPPVQRVAGLVGVECWVPADRLGPLEHVLNCAGDDLARVAEIAFAGRPEDGTHLERGLPCEHEGARVAVGAGLEGAGSLARSPVRHSIASRKSQPSRNWTRAMTSPRAPQPRQLNTSLRVLSTRRSL